MTEHTIQLDLTLVAPALADERDHCWTRLTDQLQTLRGVQKAHLLTDKAPAQLCLHYDPNLVTLAQVERMATEGGSAFADRYRHEQIAFIGMDAADSAETLAATLNQLDGMLHASVNYAAGLAFVAYDRTHPHNRIDARVRAPLRYPDVADQPKEKETIQTVRAKSSVDQIRERRSNRSAA